MTHKLIQTALLEQLVGALNEVDQQVDLTLYHTAPNEVLFDVVMEAITAGRAALANAEPTGWQPIATAPKDGSTVYASGINYNTPSRGRHFCLAHFHEGLWYETSDWNSSSTLEYLDMWAPLPAAPKEQP